MKSGIYKITNKVTDKVYVGSAIYIKNRWATHLSLLRAGTHSNKYLQASWIKHTEINFKFEIIEMCEKEKLIEREQFYIDLYDCVSPKGYNLLSIAGSPLGFKHSEETKQTMRKPKAPSHKLSISESRKGMKFEQSHSDNISKSKKNKPIDGGPSAKARLGKKRGPYKSFLDNIIESPIIIKSENKGE
jgi:group I intron endonuclease